MANPTTNYGFVLPTSSDLVTDLPADFDVALQGVDTRLKALQPGTTLGDLAYSSATANTNTRLPIGTNGQVLSVSGGVPAWTTKTDSELSINAQTGTTYTFVLADGDDKLVTASNASAQTYSIPTNANVAFPVGTVINIIAIGAGQVTINAVTSGTTTVLSNGGTAAAPKLRVQYSAASCIKVATDTWYVVGDLS
jgi:hypothetical protein